MKKTNFEKLSDGKLTKEQLRTIRGGSGKPVDFVGIATDRDDK